VIVEKGEMGFLVTVKGKDEKKTHQDSSVNPPNIEIGKMEDDLLKVINQPNLQEKEEKIALIDAQQRCVLEFARESRVRSSDAKL
jgi:hypothetical protein